MGERKPRCVILDEIDGVMGGSEGRNAITALLKIVEAGEQQWDGRVRGSASRGGSTGGKPTWDEP